MPPTISTQSYDQARQIIELATRSNAELTISENGAIKVVGFGGKFINWLSWPMPINLKQPRVNRIVFPLQNWPYGNKFSRVNAAKVWVHELRAMSDGQSL